jgi:hypothetical protein
LALVSALFNKKGNIMSNLDYAAYNRAGQMFTAANQSAATVTLINTSTATGFILSNPFGSNKKAIIASGGFQYTTVPTATAVLFWCLSIAPSAAAHASVTALQVYNADGSGATGKAQCRAYSASTTPNLPVYTRSFGYSPTTPATTGSLSSFRDYIDGALVLTPGSYLQVSYITTAPVGITDMQWIEVPLN